MVVYPGPSRACGVESTRPTTAFPLMRAERNTQQARDADTTTTPDRVRRVKLSDLGQPFLFLLIGFAAWAFNDLKSAEARHFEAHAKALEGIRVELAALSTRVAGHHGGVAAITESSEIVYVRSDPTPTPNRMSE